MYNVINMICTFKPFCDIFGSLILNISSTFIGVVLTFYFLRPKIRMSKRITYKNSGILKIGVVNLSSLGLAGIYNIKAEMLFYYTIGTRRTSVTVPLMKDSVLKLNKKLFSKPADYSYIFKSKNNVSMANDSKYEGVIFRIIATHSFSNMTRVFEHVYSMDSIIKDEDK